MFRSLLALALLAVLLSGCAGLRAMNQGDYRRQINQAASATTNPSTGTKEMYAGRRVYDAEFGIFAVTGPIMRSARMIINERLNIPNSMISKCLSFGGIAESSPVFSRIQTAVQEGLNTDGNILVYHLAPDGMFSVLTIIMRSGRQIEVVNDYGSTIYNY